MDKLYVDKYRPKTLDTLDYHPELVLSELRLTNCTNSPKQTTSPTCSSTDRMVRGRKRA